MKIEEMFQNKCIIGMVHTLPLPGTPKYKDNMDFVRERALQDAKTLEKAGVSALIVENFNDDPASIKLDMEQLTALTSIATSVKEAVNIPVGIDAAFCDWEASLTIAIAVGADFIRVPVFVDTVVMADGIVYPCASKLLRKRKALNAENILLLCDIQTKHTHMLTGSVSIEESAVNAEAALADAIIVTGAHTGAAAPVDVLKELRKFVRIPLLVGSGFNAYNALEQLPYIDGAIVGSAFKKNGIISNPVDYELAKKVMDTVKGYE